MAEKVKLHKIIEEFIHNKCSSSKKKGSFKINFHPDNNNPKNLAILYDNSNYIQCLIKKKEELDKQEKDLELLIKDSSLDLVIYRNDNELNKLNCILILIVNNYSIITKEPQKFEEGEIIDVNNDEKIIDKLKLFLFDYIKENKDKNDLNQILFNDSTNNIKFFNTKDIKDFAQDINKIKNLPNKIEINNKNSLNEILDEINPSYKEELINKYIDEMPEEIVELMKKYKNVNFNNEKYLNYINYKNNGGNENENIQEDNKEKDKENKEENKNLNSPVKTENNNEKNVICSSDKKQLFKIK